MDREKQISAIKDWLQKGSINIFGKPFAGKDTHARELAYELDARLIGGGDIMRASTDPEIKEDIDAGKLAPTEKYLGIMMPYFAQDKFADSPLVLSSVGRWSGEERGVLKATKDVGHPIKAVLNIVIDDEEIERRWRASRGSGDRGTRADDDAHHKLEVRLQEYNTKTVPVLETYRQKNLVIDINGMQEKDLVAKEILSKLANLA
ncbi:MAG: nucleoside monophosphate kinase [Candidatus Saccharibacteria bacterium]|nr:nucleoside monophosphate kinase [Candidatus Saccharibacteria bacterium]